MGVAREFPITPTPAAAHSAPAYAVELGLPEVLGTGPSSAENKDLIPRGIRALDKHREEGFLPCILRKSR